MLNLSKGVQLMLISTFSFSLMQICIKYVAHLPTHELILFRSLVSLILCLAYLVPRKIPVLGNNKKYLLLRGLFGVIALSCFFITIQRMPLASAVTIGYLSPIFTAIFAIYMLKERVAWIQWIYFAIALGGVVMIKSFDTRISMEYMLIGLIAAIFAGLAYNCVRKLKDTDHAIVVVLYFPLVAIPVMIVYSLFDWVQPQGMDWLFLLLMGIFTQIGQVNLTKALQEDVAAKMTSLKYLGTIYALIIGYFIFDETYSWLSFAGIFVVMVGVILNVKYRSRSKN